MKTIKSILIATVFLMMACNSTPDHVTEIEGTWRYESSGLNGDYEETYKIEYLEKNRFKVDVRKFFKARKSPSSKSKDNDRKDTWEMTLNEDGTQLRAKDGTPLNFSNNYQIMTNKDDYTFKRVEE